MSRISTASTDMKSTAAQAGGEDRQARRTVTIALAESDQDTRVDVSVTYDPTVDSSIRFCTSASDTPTLFGVADLNAAIQLAGENASAVLAPLGATMAPVIMPDLSAELEQVSKIVRDEMGADAVVTAKLREADAAGEVAGLVLEVCYSVTDAEEDAILQRFRKVVRRFAREVRADRRHYLALIPVTADAI